MALHQLFLPFPAPDWSYHGRSSNWKRPMVYDGHRTLLQKQSALTASSTAKCTSRTTFGKSLRKHTYLRHNHADKLGLVRTL